MQLSSMSYKILQLTSKKLDFAHQIHSFYETRYCLTDKLKYLNTSLKN